METGPIIWIKAKYAAPKTRGKYKGGEHAAPKRRYHKNAKAERPAMIKRLILDVENGGKVRWDWVPNPR